MDSSTFKLYCSQYNERIFRTIIKYIPQGYPVPHHDAVREYTMRRGKYVRPNLALLWCELFQGNIEYVFPFACAIQAAEDWFLMHDDWMDKNELRRGKPAAHILYGDEIAINAGDAMQTIMWNLAYNESKHIPTNIRDALFEKLFDIISITEQGQYLDLELSNRSISDFSLEDYWKSIHAKAAYYSVYGPMQLGVIAANGTPDDIQQIQTYGIPIGKAFQIKDDILDCVSSDSVLGKKVGTDIVDGTKTAILWHFLQHATKDHREIAESIYAKTREEKTEQDIKTMLRLFHETGSIQYTEKLVQSLATEAQDALEANFTHIPETPIKNIARDAITRVVERKK